MKNSSLVKTTLILGLIIPITLAEEKPMSVAEVLKHTPENLAQKLGDTSEAGEDHAAQVWATAKRIETESILGKTSIRSVRRLHQWRKVLNTWEDLQLQARGIESGGGSMWGHLSARNDAVIEDFLAKHMIALSAERKNDGKAFESDYLKTLNAIIDTGAKEFGEDNEYIQEHATELKEDLKHAYANLQYLLKSLPEGNLKKTIIKMTKPVSE